MRRMLALMTIMVACAGCVSTPQTKALITPIGAVGIHSFAPAERRPMSPSEVDRLAHLMQENGESATQAE